MALAAREADSHRSRPRPTIAGGWLACLWGSVGHWPGGLAMPLPLPRNCESAPPVRTRARCGRSATVLPGSQLALASARERCRGRSAPTDYGTCRVVFGGPPASAAARGFAQAPRRGRWTQRRGPRPVAWAAMAGVNRIGRLGMVNAYLVREDDGLTLIDTIIGGSAGKIVAAARQAGRRSSPPPHPRPRRPRRLARRAEGKPSQAEVIISTRDVRLLARDMSLDPDEPKDKLRGGYPGAETKPDRTVDPAIGSARSM
jgi:hypothetical protein